jgi:hypothetical protein
VAAAELAGVAFADAYLERSGDPYATLPEEMHTVDLWDAHLVLYVVLRLVYEVSSCLTFNSYMEVTYGSCPGG